MLGLTGAESKLDLPARLPSAQMEDAMMTTLMIPCAILALATSAGFAGAIGAPVSSGRVSISGVAQMKYSVQHALPPEQNASPILLLDEAAGSNRLSLAFVGMSEARSRRAKAHPSTEAPRTKEPVERRALALRDLERCCHSKGWAGVHRPERV